MGEYGYDYDTDKIIYRYGDGYATDEAGNEYMDIGNGNMVDLKTDKIHYAPTDQNIISNHSNVHSKTVNHSNNFNLWALYGVVIALWCVYFILLIFDTGPEYTLHAVGTGLLACFFFWRAKKR